MAFTLDAQQTLNPFEHSSIYQQALEHSRTFLSRVRKPYSVQASVHTNRASCSQTMLGWCKCTLRMDLEEVGINAGNWVGSAQDRNYWRALVNAALILRVP